jgi:hypothetical protein
MTRETREGWPLLTVETEVNGDSQSTNERGIPWLVGWACRTLFRFFCPHRPASWAVSRAGSPVS